VIGAESGCGFDGEDGRAEEDGEPGMKEVWPAQGRWPVRMWELQGGPWSGCHYESLLSG
jgi:hypothetical protein